MKTFVYEWVSRVEIDANSEEEALAKLEEQGHIVDDYELIDIWGPDADSR